MLFNQLIIIILLVPVSGSSKVINNLIERRRTDHEKAIEEMNQEMLLLSENISCEIRSACDTFRIILTACQKAVQAEVYRLKFLNQQEFTDQCYRYNNFIL